eukprot:3753219-Prymnesium_polylepis.1
MTAARSAARSAAVLSAVVGFTVCSARSRSRSVVCFAPAMIASSSSMQPRSPPSGACAGAACTGAAYVVAAYTGAA